MTDTSKRKRGRPLGSKNRKTSAALMKHPYFSSDDEGKAKLIQNALIKTQGRITHAATILKIDRHTLSNHIKESEYLQRIVWETKEKLLDDAEKVLWEGVKSGGIEWVKLALRFNQLSSRGYTMGENGFGNFSDVKINYIVPDKDTKFIFRFDGIEPESDELDDELDVEFK